MNMPKSLSGKRVDRSAAGIGPVRGGRSDFDGTSNFNLVENAFRHGSDSGKVYLSVFQEGAKTVCEIKIPEKYR